MFINKIKNALILKRNFRNFSQKTTRTGKDIAISANPGFHDMQLAR